MATSDDSGKFKGNIGNLTYRIFNGIAIVQTRPGPKTVKQTVSTKASSVDFALSSNRAKVLREILYPMIRGMHDNKMVNRLNAAVGDVIRSNMTLAPGYRDLEDGDLQFLDGFEFNRHSPFSKMLKAKLRLDQNYLEGIKISLDAFDVKEAMTFPEMASGCTLRVLLSAVSLARNEYQYCGTAELDIPVNSEEVPEIEWSFLNGLPENCLFVASCSLEYYEDGLFDSVSLNHKHFNPVALIGLMKGRDFEVQDLLPEENSSNWNTWLPISGINGNKLRLG
ncbi:hypothetical protein [Pedobacter immunditicola]|uniref:hypothetical protein n=1 Tax=Pedobacter immunditicola TaxID=3133440 RepID=UPI0030AE21DD